MARSGKKNTSPHQSNHGFAFKNFGSPPHSYLNRSVQLLPSPSVQRCDETVNMDELLAFSHSFWGFLLSIGPLERSGSQSFRESSVRCSIIQSGSMLETETTGREAGDRDGGVKPPALCKSLDVAYLGFSSSGEIAGERSRKHCNI